MDVMEENRVSWKEVSIYSDPWGHDMMSLRHDLANTGQVSNAKPHLKLNVAAKTLVIPLEWLRRNFHCLVFEYFPDITDWPCSGD